MVTANGQGNRDPPRARSAARGASVLTERLELNNLHLPGKFQGERSRKGDGLIKRLIRMAGGEHFVWAGAIGDAQLIDDVFNLRTIAANNTNERYAILYESCDKRIESRSIEGPTVEYHLLGVGQR